MSRAAAIIVAAGAGERLGAGLPKALATLAGEPLLAHSLRAFGQCEAIGDVVVVVGREDMAAAAALLAEAAPRFADTAEICAGGDTRSESVALGLGARAPGSRLVAVHDAARPLVTPELIERTIAALAAEWDAVAPALPIVDTLKRVSPQDQSVEETVDRARVWAVQTPQVFERVTLERAHEQAGVAAATDDLALVEQLGGRVRLIAGERSNLKITYPDDLLIAEALIARRRSSERA